MTGRSSYIARTFAADLAAALGGVAAVVLLTILVTAAIGWRPYVISSGSMSPTLGVGDLVISRPLEGRVPLQGAIITFYADDGGITTHRIVRLEGDFLQTKGDANAVSDSYRVPLSRIMGVGVLRVPFVALPLLVGRGWLLGGLGLLLGLTLLDGIRRRALPHIRRPWPRLRRPWPRPGRLIGAGLLLGAVLGVGLVVFSSGALFSNSRANPNNGIATAASFAPTVSNSVISKTVLYWPAFIKQNGAYYVYANVTGTDVSTVRTDVSAISTGQTSVALVSGSYSIGGVSYNYRSASVTANATLTAGSKSYAITATDVTGNSATTSGFSVTVDNTSPTGTNVQTTNAGVAGKAELGDKVVLTFSEVIDPQSVLSGWTGLSTNVVLRLTNGSGGDLVTVWNAANLAQLPLGTVNLIGKTYTTTTINFGVTGTPSTMVVSGNSIVITLGTASGTTGTQASPNNMTWVPSATATDRAANAGLTTTVTEATPLDLDF